MRRQRIAQANSARAQRCKSGEGDRRRCDEGPRKAADDGGEGERLREVNNAACGTVQMCAVEAEARVVKLGRVNRRGGLLQSVEPYSPTHAHQPTQRGVLFTGTQRLQYCNQKRIPQLLRRR